MKYFAKGFVAAAVSLAVTATPALATKANQLQSLVGARGSSGEMELERQGFVSVTGRQGDGGVHTYWWNARDKNCINVFTANGRYESIKDAQNSDCNQKNNSSAGAAIAGAAVGALLIAALTSHKSDHHDDGQHYADQQAEVQYERGYNDGLHNSSYHNYERTDAYSNGYTAGVQQRNRNTSYHSNKGGYAPHASLSGIQGQDAIWAIDEMRNRGFANVDTMTSGSAIYGIYYNRSTRQCVQMITNNRAVEDVREIYTHPKCR